MIDHSQPDSAIRRMGATAWSLLGTLLLLAAIGWILIQVRVLLPPVVFAIVIIYVLNPVVTKLQERGLARWLGSCLSYLVLAGVLTLIGFLVIPSLIDQGRGLADDFPAIYDNLIEDLEDFADRLGFDVDLPDYREMRGDLEAGQDDFLGDQWGRITDITLSLLEGIALLVLAPVVAFYVLLDLPTVRRKTLDLIPERLRAETSFVASEMGTALGGFLRGQLLVALIVGVMTAVGFRAIDLPFWLLIGMIAGFLNIIPFVGPWVGGALGVATALATRDVRTAVLAALVALIVQQIDNHFVSPTVLRATVHIHPALIILGLIGGAAVGGFWGVLLAVPVMAMTKILVGHLWRTRVLGQPWQSAAMVEQPAPRKPALSRLRRGRSRDRRDGGAGDEERDAAEQDAGRDGSGDGTRSG